MAKLLVCIDGSAYADNICANAAWAAKRLNANIDLLHVLRRDSDYKGPSDHTGSIGVSERSSLLEELTKVDEERGRLDQKKGQVILNHGENIFKEAGIKNINSLHRRGSLVETIQEFEEDTDLIFMGKRGEHANVGSVFLGSNLEKVARAVHKPLFVVSSTEHKIENFLIAYDGKKSADKAIDYIVNSSLLKGLDCHLLAVEQNKGDIKISEAEGKLKSAGFNVTTVTKQSNDIGQEIVSYVESNEIDLLATGAYSHSRIRNLLAGSTTGTLLKSCHIPLLLFR